MDDEDQLRSLVAAMEHGWNAHDGKAYAAPFTEDADFIALTGLRAHGRDQIAAGHQEIFDSIFAGTTVRLRVNAIRRLRPDVAVLDLTSDLSGGTVGPAQSHPFAVATREDGRWCFQALHNMMPVSRPAAGPIEEALL